MKYYLIISFILIVLTGQAFGDVELQLIVNNNKISIDDELSFKVSVKGVRSTNNEPQFLSFKDFDIEFNGSSSNISIINGEITANKSFSYTAAPKRIGSFQVGPAQINIKGKTYTSNIVNIEVIKESPLSKKNTNFFVEASVDNKTPYLGQGLLYTFKLFYRSNINNLQFIPPKFNDFTSKQIDKGKNYQIRNKGVIYNVIEVQFSLFPKKYGELVIGKTTIVGSILIADGRRSFDSFFSGFGRPKRIRLFSNKILVSVKKLPEFNLRGVNSNLIGKFNLQSTISSQTSSVGDSLTLTYTLEGEGDISGALLPQLTLDRSIKIYADKPIVTLDYKGKKIIGKKIFKFALVPQKEGVFQIKKQNFNYFNPIVEKFETISSQSYSINVSKGEIQELNLIKSNNLRDKINTKDEKLNLLSNDLMDIQRNITDFSNNFLLYVLGLINFFLLLLNIFFRFKRIRDFKLGNDKNLKRQSLAYSTYKTNMSSFKSNSFSPVEKSKVLRRYIGDKLQVDGVSLTGKEISVILNKRGLSKNLVDDISDVLDECESLTYSGLSDKKLDYKSCKESLDKIVKNLEKEI